MKSTQTLTRHRDIRNWVVRRHGAPAICPVRDTRGEVRARLMLSFSKARLVASMPTQDDGMSPVSWTAWLAELDRQHLALRIDDQGLPSFELVKRGDLN